MELPRSVITGETCACTAIMADRTTLGPIRRPAVCAIGLRADPSAGLPPPTHQRPDRLRQAAAAPALRLFLSGDRRTDLLGHHDLQPPRRVDRPRRLRLTQTDRA